MSSQIFLRRKLSEVSCRGAINQNDIFQMHGCRERQHLIEAHLSEAPAGACTWHPCIEEFSPVAGVLLDAAVGPGMKYDPVCVPH